MGKAEAVDAAEDEGTFQVVDTAEPNAFALQGGHVYVSRGLLALVNSEDELAGAIGHLEPCTEPLRGRSRSSKNSLPSDSSISSPAMDVTSSRVIRRRG